MNKNYLYAVIFFAFLFSAIFTLFPQIDIWFSSLFYNKQEGFFLKNNFLVSLSYKAVRYMVLAIILFCLIILAMNMLKKTTLFSFRQVIFLLLVLAIGPGLIVNTALKDNRHRARPSQVMEFGGSKKFTAPLSASDQCDRNCSFSSGHASIGFFFVCFAFLLKKRKAVIYFGSILFGIVIGFGRVLQGGHFLSDVIFSGIVVLLTAHIIYILLFNMRFLDKEK